MLNRIIIFLSVITINVCCAAEQPLYVPPFIEQTIIKDALIRPPYPALTKWLISRYRKVNSGQPDYISVRHADDRDSCRVDDSMAIGAVAITPDGSKVITGCYRGDNTVKIWNMADGSLITQVNTNAISRIYDIKISPDGSKFVTVHYHGAQLWNIDGSFIANLPESSRNSPDCFRISPDGSKCAAGLDGGIVKIWNMYDGTLIETRNIPSDYPLREISPDFSKVCTMPNWKCVEIWNVKDGTLFRTIDGCASSVKITHDGTKIVISSGDCKIWNMDNGELIGTLPLEIGRTEIRAISPDGFICLNSFNAHCNYQSDRETVKICDSNTSNSVAILFDEETGIQDMVYSASIGPRCLQAVTGHHDGTFRIWTVIPPDLLDALSTISLEQLWLLEGIFEQAIKDKKADLSHINKPEIINYVEQYGLLPNLIKDLVKDYVRFE